MLEMLVAPRAVKREFDHRLIYVQGAAEGQGLLVLAASALKNLKRIMKSRKA